MMKDCDKQFLQEFSSKVRQIRYELKISQEDLAELADCHVNALGRIERCQAEPSLGMIIRIARALKISPKDLIPL